MFQCKKYKRSVTPKEIRDFQGALLGRCDKAIFITTGTFTIGAQKEAMRDGGFPIELVDGEKLLDTIETLELGLKKALTYEIENKFFEEFS
jgi:restriction system protein